jgi:hypothetical protein
MKLTLFTLMIIFSLPSFAEQTGLTELPTYRCEIKGHGMIFDENGKPEKSVEIPRYTSLTKQESWQNCMRLGLKLARELKPVILINLDGGKPTTESRNDFMFLYFDWNFTNPDQIKKYITGKLTVFTGEKEGFPMYGDRRYLPNGLMYSELDE